MRLACLLCLLESCQYTRSTLAILDPSPNPNPDLVTRNVTLSLSRLNIGTELVGEGTSSGRLQRQMRYALESGWERLKWGSK